MLHRAIQLNIAPRGLLRFAAVIVDVCYTKRPNSAR